MPKIQINLDEETWLSIHIPRPLMADLKRIATLERSTVQEVVNAVLADYCEQIKEQEQ